MTRPLCRGNGNLNILLDSFSANFEDLEPIGEYLNFSEESKQSDDRKKVESRLVACVEDISVHQI